MSAKPALMLASRKLIRCFPTLLDVAGNNSVTSSPGSGGLRTGVTASVFHRGLSLVDWLGCAAVASSVLWLRELSKSITRGLKA